MGKQVLPAVAQVCSLISFEANLSVAKIVGLYRQIFAEQLYLFQLCPNFCVFSPTLQTKKNWDLPSSFG